MTNVEQVKPQSQAQQLMSEGWRITYLRQDRTKSTGHAVFTILTRRLPMSQTLTETYEVKYSICNPKDSFCRSEGVKIAAARESVFINSSREMVIIDFINSLDSTKLTTDAKDTLGRWCFDQLTKELTKLTVGILSKKVDEVSPGSNKEVKVKVYRSSTGGCAYLHKDMVYPFVESLPSREVAKTVVNRSRQFFGETVNELTGPCPRFPNGLEAAYITTFTID